MEYNNSRSPAYLASNFFDEFLDWSREIDDKSVHIKPQDPVVLRQPLADEVGLVEMKVGVSSFSIPVYIETHAINVIPGRSV